MEVSNDKRVDKQIRSLPRKDSARIIGITGLLSNSGFNLSEQYLKKLTTNLWELRTGQWRLLFGLIKGEAVIVNIFLKKTQKAPRREIETALNRLKEYQ